MHIGRPADAFIVYMCRVYISFQYSLENIVIRDEIENSEYGIEKDPNFQLIKGTCKTEPNNTPKLALFTCVASDVNRRAQISLSFTARRAPRTQLHVWSVVAPDLVWIHS